MRGNSMEKFGPMPDTKFTPQHMWMWKSFSIYYSTLISRFLLHFVYILLFSIPQTMCIVEFQVIMRRMQLNILAFFCYQKKQERNCTCTAKIIHSTRAQYTFFIHMNSIQVWFISEISHFIESEVILIQKRNVYLAIRYVRMLLILEITSLCFALLDEW